MKPVDKIEQLKDSTYHLHKQEDGMIDMVMGLLLACIWAGFHLQFVLIFFAMIPIIPFVMRRMKRKLVYPRVGFAVFSDLREQKPFLKFGLYLLFVGLGLITLFWFGSLDTTRVTQLPLFYLFCILASGLLIAGSITQKQLFYVAGVGLIWPSISSLITMKTWFGMPLSIVFNVSSIGLILWLLAYRKPIVDKKAARRPNLVIHSAFLSTGILGLIVILLQTYNPGLVTLLEAWIGANPEVVFGSVVALIFLIVGLALAEVRYYLYAALVCTVAGAAYVITGFKSSAVAVISIIGLMILLLGIIQFISFLKRNPKLEGPNEELEI